MTKLIALVAAGMFAAGTMFAGDHGDCAKHAGNDGKMACTVAMADLNLTAEQKTKMETLMAEHHKEGCTEATEKKFMPPMEKAEPMMSLVISSGSRHRLPYQR